MHRAAAAARGRWGPEGGGASVRAGVARLSHCRGRGRAVHDGSGRPSARLQLREALFSGKAKLGKLKKVFWKHRHSGLLCSVEKCTWEGRATFSVGADALVSAELVGKAVTLEEQGSTFVGTIVKAVGGNVYHVRYTGKLVPTKDGNAHEIKSTKKKARDIDLELPSSEKTSWWRVDGYDTDVIEVASDQEQEEDNDTDSDGDCMAEDE